MSVLHSVEGSVNVVGDKLVCVGDAFLEISLGW